MLKFLDLFRKKEPTRSPTWKNPTEPFKAKFTTDEIDASDLD